MYRFSLYSATGLGVFLLFLSCNPTTDFIPGSGPSSDGSSSVGDVTDGTNDAGNPIGDAPPFDAVQARVRNESTARADVTLRFIHDDQVVHLAFVRVPPDTITTIASPEAVDTVELSGVDERGRALPAAEFVFGVDFDNHIPAEYAIAEESGPTEPPPVRPTPPSLRLTAPAAAATLTIGTTFEIEWVDSGSSAATVAFFLRKIGTGANGELFALGPAIGAALDGINDSFRAVLEGVVPGRYEVLGRIEDGGLTAQSIAPGVVRVVRDPENTAPVITIRKPTSLTLLRNGESVRIEWSDADPDNNATIVFSLVPSAPASISGEAFAISPPIAEDADGTASDGATLTIHDVLPGLYDLVATIDDGRLIGTDRVVGAVRIVPTANNDLPRLDILEPFEDERVAIGGAITARWTDSDDNDNARITWLLDPDLGNVLLNGNEIVLAASIGEDEDGAADRIALAVPGTIAAGRYRLVGVITDGLTQVITRAPGFLTLEAAVPPPTGGDPGTGGGDGGLGGGDSVGGDPTGGVIPVQPALEVIDEPGERITVVITLTDVAIPRQTRVFLSNVRYSGDFREDVTPVTGPAPTSKTYSIVVNTDVVPNMAWPRSFDVEVETVIDGLPTTSYSPRPIWIRQEISFMSVRALNYTCVYGGPITTDPSGFVGIEWTWYGGGFDAAPPLANVAFWLSADGQIPADDRSNSTHVPVFWGAASPNALQTTRVSLDVIRGMESSRTAGSQPVVISAPVGLLAGEYYLVSVLDEADGTRLVTTLPTAKVEVCPPAASAAGGGQQP